MGGIEPSLKISAPKLLEFWSEGVLNIFAQRMTESLNELMSNKGVFRTAPATPGRSKT